MVIKIGTGNAGAQSLRLGDAARTARYAAEAKAAAEKAERSAGIAAGALQDTADNARRAEAAAAASVHPPVPGTGGTWLIWDQENGGYIDSGENCRGEKGETGGRGEKGDKGDAFSYADFTPAQLEALRGPQGAAGPKGDKGDTGATGPAPDMSAYRTAAAQDVIDEAQNAEIADLKSAFDYGEIVGDSTIFESGSFSSSGVNRANANRLRTIGYVSPNIKSVYTKNGYKLGVYCYNKSNNSWAGFVYTDGSVGKDVSKFTFLTSFTFDDPRYSAYNFRLLCAPPDTSAGLTVAEANNYILVKNGAVAIVQNAIETIPVLAHGAYIKTEVGYGNIVSLLPITYDNYDCAISDCTEGDIFTVTGTGGGSGRLWAFIDSDNVLIPPAANSSISADSEIVIAPENSAKIIFNANSNLGYNFTKGNISGFSLSTKSSLIESAEVHNSPSAIVKPTIVYKSAVNETQGVSDVKGSIFRSNNDFCIIYNENLDGNVKDLPSVSGTGTLAIKYKFFHYENGVESNVSYGEIARKGTEYTNWNGVTMQLDGGCGMPSGISGIQYFTSAYNGTKRYNEVDNYGLRPCACTVSVNSSGVTFGEIKELSLTINGDKGAFDISRIDPSYVDYYIYYTTTPPCKINDTLWYWLQPVIHGIAVFRSSNGFDWELCRVVNTPYQPQCEVTCVHLGSNTVCFAARTSETNSNIFVGCLNAPYGRIITQYKLRSITSRGYLIKDDKGILLFYNPTSYDTCTCIRITANSSQLFFHEWFSIFKDCTWYVAPDPTLLTANYTKMLLVGNNGNVGSNRGLTFMELNMGASPKIIDDMSAGIE